jgi:glycosyltransferase involved in cell wall biosynthesis
MPIAFFTPLSPMRTAIADLSEGLLPSLRELVDVDLYIDDGYWPRDPRIARRFRIRTYREFPAHADRYDAILYAIGDDARCHGYIYGALQRFPGIVLLHDVTLHRLVANLAFRTADTEFYLREMRYAYGMTDLRVGQRAVAGFGSERALWYPLLERVVDCSLGVIVYNGYARRQVLRRCPHARVAQINYHFALPAGFVHDVDVGALRRRWGLEDRFVIGSCGLFVPDKRLQACLRAFARFREHHARAVYLLIGSSWQGPGLPRLIDELGLRDHVVLTGWLDPPSFAQHMQLLDVAVHLRYPHIGGTPFTPIRLMGLGLPTIVSDIQPLAELPEGACIKVAPDPYEEDTLYKLFLYLAENSDVRSRLGANASRWIHDHHEVRQVAEQHLAAAKQFTFDSAEKVVDRRVEHQTAHLVREVARFGCDIGVRDSDEAFLCSVAETAWGQLAGRGRNT